jgi:CDP-4-dehydro-6-deoxyglucose reductase
MEILKYKAKVSKKEYFNGDTIYLKIDRPTKYHFLPGQFLQIFFENIKRSYSIFSKPSEKTIDLCIKLLEGGQASELFKNIEENDEIEISEAMGHFIINEDDVERTYVATGSGLAPIVSMIKTSLEDYHHKSKIYLLFGLRHEENIFYQKELETLTSKYPNFSFDITLSQPKEDAKNLSGRVTAHIPSKVSERKHNYFYLCGSPDMVKDVRRLLIDNDVDVKNIKFEIF